MTARNQRDSSINEVNLICCLLSDVLFCAMDGLWDASWRVDREGWGKTRGRRLVKNPETKFNRGNSSPQRATLATRKPNSLSPGLYL
jgi:hypothetical protein